MNESWIVLGIRVNKMNKMMLQSTDRQLQIQTDTNRENLQCDLMIARQHT